MFEYFSGISLTALNAIMQKFLKDTEDAYTSFEKKAKENLIFG